MSENWFSSHGDVRLSVKLSRGAVGVACIWSLKFLWLSFCDALSSLSAAYFSHNATSCENMERWSLHVFSNSYQHKENRLAMFTTALPRLSQRVVQHSTSLLLFSLQWKPETLDYYDEPLSCSVSRCNNGVLHLSLLFCLALNATNQHTLHYLRAVPLKKNLLFENAMVAKTNSSLNSLCSHFSLWNISPNYIWEITFPTYMKSSNRPKTEAGTFSATSTVDIFTWLMRSWRYGDTTRKQDGQVSETFSFSPALWLLSARSK